MSEISYFFHPENEDAFKKEAKGNFVRTMIIDLDNHDIKTYSRSVNVIWTQTRKNNIETDQRVKDLKNGNYHIYSWVVSNNNDFKLPCFAEHASD